MAYVVAGMPFKVQTAKAILDRCGKLIGKEWRRIALDGDALEFMMAAWKRSPGYREKDGDAVVGICVVRNTGSGYGFRAVYGDSSDIDFAYEPCFTGIPGNPTNKVLHALRRVPVRFRETEVVRAQGRQRRAGRVRALRKGRPHPLPPQLPRIRRNQGCFPEGPRHQAQGHRGAASRKRQIHRRSRPEGRMDRPGGDIDPRFRVPVRGLS